MAKNAGIAVIVSTHLQDVLANLTDDIIVMAKGEILGRLPSSELTGSEGIARYQQILLEAGVIHA